jgi:hypothetical protein
MIRDHGVGCAVHDALELILDIESSTQTTATLGKG